MANTMTQTRTKTSLKIVAKNVVQPAIGLAVFFAVWWIAARANNNPLLLESPWVTVKAAAGQLTSASFLGRMLSSFSRAAAGFGISFVLALALGILTVVFDIQKVFSPVITIVRAVPTVAVIILILLWSDSMVTPIAVAVLVIFPTLYSSFLVTLSAANKELLETAKVFGAGPVGVVRYVYLPALRRSIVENTASGLSLSLKLVISAEIMVSTARSIGQFMKAADRDLQIAQLLAAALLVALFCILIEFLVRLPLRSKAFDD